MFKQAIKTVGWAILSSIILIGLIPAIFACVVLSVVTGTWRRGSYEKGP